MSRLNDFVRKAIIEVPYYRDTVRLDDDGEIKFESIPLLTKSIVQSMGNKMFAEHAKCLYNKKELLIARTSGSTGRYMKIYWSRQDQTKSMAELYLIRKKFYGITPGDRLCYFFTTLYKGNTLVDNEKFSENIAARQLGISKELLSQENIQNVYERIKSFNPIWMILQPSIALMLAKYLDDNCLDRFESLKYIEFTGEMLTKDCRNYIEKIFECKTNNQYGANEFNSIACERGDKKLYVNQSNVYIEILDENNRPVFDKEGEIYVTTLTNETMPLIRYQLGDRGVLHKERENLILELSCGRSSEYIQLADSLVISPYIFLKAIEEINENLGEVILQFKIIQKAVNDFKVLFLVSKKYRGWRDSLSKRFIENLNMECFKDAKWDIDLVDEIEFHEKTKKYNYFVNEMRVSL